MSKSLIILDRDGVINYDSKNFIKKPDEWIAIPGSLEAIAKLNAHFNVVVATNQSGVGRGLYDLNMLQQIHEKMLHELAFYSGKIDGIYFCPHRPEEQCHCRKPNTGLYEQIAHDFSVNLENCIVIGDSWRDIEAGLKVGAQCILVLTGNGQTTQMQHQTELNSVIIQPDLSAAVNYILDHHLASD